MPTALINVGPSVFSAGSAVLSLVKANCESTGDFWEVRITPTVNFYQTKIRCLFFVSFVFCMYLVVHRAHIIGSKSVCSVIFTVRKRSLGQGNVFTPVCQSFCSRGGACPTTCWDTYPLGRHPPGIHPSPLLGRPLTQADTPSPRQTPPGCYSIQSTSGWYASYWNAYLLGIFYPCQTQKIIIREVTFNSCKARF